MKQFNLVDCIIFLLQIFASMYVVTIFTCNKIFFPITGASKPDGLKWYITEGRGYHRDTDGWSDRITITGEQWYQLLFTAQLAKKRGRLRIKNVATGKENSIPVRYI